MSEIAIPRFSCDGCGKKYPWKPELSNKKAKCKCGLTITVPDLSVPSDEPPPLPDDGILDFIESAPEVASTKAEALRAKAKPVAMPATATKKSATGRAAPVLGYRQGPTAREQKRAGEQFNTIHDLKRDVYVPTALIVGSFLAYFLWLVIHGTAVTSTSIGVYGAIMALTFGVKTICMIGGAFIVASLAGVSFGPFWTAVLKLAAVAIAPDIFATIIEEAINSPGAGLLAGSLALGFYWFLISWLFSMDASEAWIVVVLFGFLRWLLQFIVGMILISILMNGGGSSIAGAASAIPTVSAEAMALNDNVANWKENDLLVEGLDYIDQTGRQSAEQALIKAVYAAGAKNVWFHVARDINGKKEPMSLVIEWPRAAEKRQAVIDAIKKDHDAREKRFVEEHKDMIPLEFEPVTDEGGKYLEIDVDS